MDKKKIEIIAIVVLSLIFVFFMKQALFPAKKKGKKASIAMSASTTVDDEGTIFTVFDQNLAFMEQREDYRGIDGVLQGSVERTWGRNPFVGYLARQEEEGSEAVEVETLERPAFSIQGILFYKENPDDSSVVVNGDLVRKGESFNGWKLIHIEQDNAIFKKNDTEYIFPLYNE